VILIKLVKNIKDYDKIFNNSEIQILHNINNNNKSLINNINQTNQNNYKRKSSDKILGLSKQNSVSKSSLNSINFITINSNQILNKNLLEKSMTLQENHITNGNLYTATTPNLKVSYKNLTNLSNSAKSNIKNTIPEREESDSFFNMNIGSDRMSHATFTNTSLSKLGEATSSKQYSFPTQSNQDIVGNKITNTKDISVTDTNTNRESNFFI